LTIYLLFKYYSYQKKIKEFFLKISLFLEKIYNKYDINIVLDLADSKYLFHKKKCNLPGVTANLLIIVVITIKNILLLS